MSLVFIALQDVKYTLLHISSTIIVRNCMFCLFFILQLTHIVSSAGQMKNNNIDKLINSNDNGVVVCQTVQFQRIKSLCVTNVLDIYTKPTPLRSPSSVLPNKLKSISLVRLFLKLLYLAMLFILQLTHTDSSARQVKNK